MSAGARVLDRAVPEPSESLGFMLLARKTAATAKKTPPA